jgi:hypothetical protein
MVKDRVLRDIGAKAPLKNWYAIDWKLATKRVRNLRGRKYQCDATRAVESGEEPDEADATELQ